MTTNNFKTKSVMNKIISDKRISKDKILVNYLPKLDLDLINKHDLNIIKIFNKYKDH